MPPGDRTCRRLLAIVDEGVPDLVVLGGEASARPRTSPRTLIDEPAAARDAAGRMGDRREASPTPRDSWRSASRSWPAMRAPSARPARRPWMPGKDARSASTPPTELQAPVDDALDLHGRRVLVADDDPAIAWYFADILRARGMRRGGGRRRRSGARPRPTHGPRPGDQRHPDAPDGRSAPLPGAQRRSDPGRRPGRAPVLEGGLAPAGGRVRRRGFRVSGEAQHSGGGLGPASARSSRSTAGSSGACAFRAPCADGSTARRPTVCSAWRAPAGRTPG